MSTVPAMIQNSVTVTQLNVSGNSSQGDANTPQRVEKLTMKIKKSQFSPNEMVVVGSARDAQEQMVLK